MIHSSYDVRKPTTHDEARARSAREDVLLRCIGMESTQSILQADCFSKSLCPQTLFARKHSVWRSVRHVKQISGTSVLDSHSAVVYYASDVIHKYVC